ncbi:MAG: DUF4923 family protein [Bacteroidales bacterium]|nr:DUF4923 family protein [Bacteroidales bacterium]
MKKYLLSTGLSVVTCLFSLLPASGQSGSLKDLFKSDKVKDVVSAVIPQKDLTIEDIEGTWHYAGSACKFTSDDLLKKAGGAVAANELEKKLDGVYSKLGLNAENCYYTFNTDSTFSSKSGKSVSNGKFTLSPEEEYNVNLSFQLIKLINLKTVEARIERSSDKLILLFNADKLLKLLSYGASSQNTTLKTIGTLANEYSGALIGFEMKK